MDNEIEAIEARMLSAAQQMVRENREALDRVDLAKKQRISEILGYGPFGTEGWLVSPCSYLGGRRPLDLLEIDELAVSTAAVRVGKWGCHG
jgi:hypothetical protein